MKAGDFIPLQGEESVPMYTYELHGQRQRKKGQTEGVLWGIVLGSFAYLLVHMIFGNSDLSGFFLVAVPIIGSIFVSNKMED